MILRAVERIDPRALYGRPWCELERAEQTELLGYEMLREYEENPPAEPTAKP